MLEHMFLCSGMAVLHVGDPDENGMPIPAANENFQPHFQRQL